MKTRAMKLETISAETSIVKPLNTLFVCDGFVLLTRNLFFLS